MSRGKGEGEGKLNRDRRHMPPPHVHRRTVNTRSIKARQDAAIYGIIHGRGPRPVSLSRPPWVKDEEGDK